MLSIRAANVNDVALLKALICELAEYERARTVPSSANVGEVRPCVA